jgi:N-acetylglucosamine-6-sulfatase
MLAASLLATAVLLALGGIMDWGRAAGLPLAIVNGTAFLHFVILLGAPLVLYPVLFALGGTALQRVALSLLPAGVWWLGEVTFRAQSHSLPEAVFLAASTFNYLHLQVLVLELALADLVCRLFRLGRGTSARVLLKSAGGVLLALIWLSSTFALAFPMFLGYQDAYRALFQGDLPVPVSYPGPLEPAAPSGWQPPASLPNVVVILSDDHGHDFMGNAGHAFVETPSLDRLAAEGVRFRNAFVTSSLCSPSRASFLTGQDPERHGVFNNFTPWNDGNRTFFEHLKRAGYRTAFIGKWHMPGGLPDLRGVDEFVTFTAAGGQGLYVDCPLVVNRREEPSRRRYIAEELTDRALAFVEAHRDEPFVLYLSHKNVHYPFRPDDPEQGRYADAPFELPPDAEHDWIGMTRSQYVHIGLQPLSETVRQYAAAVTSMDRQIGRVLDAIDGWGLSERTLVLYTSDNGQLFGEHGLIDKRWAYEPSIRIPLLLRYPPLTGSGATTLDAMVLNLDLAPTLLDLAELPVPDAMQGRSLLPLLGDPQAPWRDAFLYRYFFEAPYVTPTLEAVRTDRYKLVRYAHGETELFDLLDDPDEHRNLATNESRPEWATDLERRLTELRAEVR